VTFSIVCGNFSQKEKMCMEKEWNIEFLIWDLIAHSVCFVKETGKNNARQLFCFFKLQLINGNRHWKNNLRKSNCRPGRM
jgi:hypothetical protein